MALVGLADPIFSKMLMNDAFYKTPFRLVFLGLTVGLTATSVVFLDRSSVGEILISFSIALRPCYFWRKDLRVREIC